ncbi:MAG: TlpA disulfide reductase family protein [Ferruginibacter sp.]
MKIFYCLMGLLCPLVSLQAQEHSIKPLTVGDAAPAMILNNVYNHPATTIDISNRKGKPLLIDFWASWCVSCIGLMPKLEDFKEKFAGQMEMISVNIEPADTEEKINTFLKKRKERTGLEMKMAYALQDTLLQHYFPPAYLPELVWIDGRGRIAAITDAYALNKENLQRFSNGEILNNVLHPKKSFKKANPLGETNENGIIYRNSLSPEDKNMQAGLGFKTDSAGNRQCYYAINYPLIALLQLGYPEAMKNGRDRIVYDGDKAGLYKKYSYEFTGADMSEENIQLQIRLVLKNALKITAYSADRKIPCAVLTAYKEKLLPVSLNKKAEYDIDKLSLHKRLLNQPPGSLLTIISKWYKIPVLEETKLQKISIELPFDIYDYTKQQLLAFLKTQGFIITETERIMPVAVIKTIP